MIDSPAPETTRPDGIALSPRQVGSPNEARALIALTMFPFIAMMRNIATFAFGFLFPVVFISVFGLIGGGGGGPRYNFGYKRAALKPPPDSAENRTSTTENPPDCPPCLHPVFSATRYRT